MGLLLLLLPPGTRLLLAASLLSFCFLLAGAQSVGTVTVTADSQQPIEGGSVTLTPSSIPGNAKNCRWFREKDDGDNLILNYYLPDGTGVSEGPNFTRRETVKPGCALHITNLNANDSGTYQIVIDGPGVLQKGTVGIAVQEKLSKPTLSPPSYMPLAKEDVLLECHTSSSPSVNVSWFKDGNPLQAPNAVPSGNNRNLTITNFTKADDGNYSCEAANAISKERSDPSVITMAYGPDNLKINQSGNISVALGTQLVLLCSADSNPAAQFRWFFNNSDMKVMEEIFRVGSLTWEDGGNYTCQAHNNRTNHTAAASVIVKVTSEACPGGCHNSGLSAGAIAGIVIGCLAAVILVAGLVYYLCTKTSLGRTERHTSNGNISSAPGQNQGATDTKPRTGEEDIQYSTLAFNANSPPQPAPGAGQPLDSNIIYSEIKKK